MGRTVLFVGAALVLITINLRLAVGSVSPVLDDIRATLGLSSTVAGLLTTAPVLCFGLAAPLAPRLARRFGQEALLLGALAAVVAGLAIRIAPAVAPVFGGTVVLGVGIAVANVLMPSVIKRRFASPGLMMGLFTMSLSISAALGAAFTVPLEQWLGSWRWALAFWGLLALLAIVVWAPFVHSSPRGPTEGAVPRTGLRRLPMAWLVTGAFGFQAMLFFSLLSWTPDVLRDAGLSSGAAGAMLSVAMLCGIPPSLAMPVLMARRADQRWLALFAPAAWVLGLAGLLADPGGATWLWMVLTGIGQGAGIAFGLTLVVVRSADAGTAAALSGMTQGVGYTFAALGPFALGAVHDATGGWEAPIAIMLALTVGMVVCGSLAGRDRPIPPHEGS
jgi:MFS transporter, CP family, cyanate transporter